MGLPTPQFNTPLTPAQINPELSIYPIYGVTPDDKYTPISITENGQLSIGSVTISGPVTVTDIVIKGVDPDASFVSEDVDVFNLGAGHGWSLRTTLFDSNNNHLAINNDGSINVNATFSNSTIGLVNITHLQINPATEDTLAALNTKVTTTANGIKVDGSGVTQPTSIVGSASSTLSSVSASVTGVTLLVANPNRKMTTVYNDSASDMYVALGIGVSVSNFSAKVKANGYYECPLPIYLGSITAIWDSAIGSARITELY